MNEDVVLIIDADDLERRCLSQMFRQARFDIVEAAASVEGLFQILESDPALILLAEEMPPLQAADLLTVLRHLTDAPIVVIGSGGGPDEVTALDDGADYYIRRPLSRAVLLARSRALLRRRHGGSRRTKHSRGARSLREGLTSTERRLLVCLAAHYGRPAAPERVIAEAWNGRVTPGAVKFYVWRLRQKLQGSDLRIQSLASLGYRLVRAGTGDARGRVAG